MGSLMLDFYLRQRYIKVMKVYLPRKPQSQLSFSGRQPSFSMTLIDAVPSKKVDLDSGQSSPKSGLLLSVSVADKVTRI